MTVTRKRRGMAQSRPHADGIYVIDTDHTEFNRFGVRLCRRRGAFLHRQAPRSVKKRTITIENIIYICTGPITEGSYIERLLEEACRILVLSDNRTRVCSRLRAGASRHVACRRGPDLGMKSPSYC